ncbi:hypothetical protein SAMD00019534_068130 [Acytostelium subglobosum LB1]|uniref:hypothetical protein n=1 Tax=Acytostelium subglobosum LB1 TaxID=1410327 RepID=UPI00064512F8|nr:hypothetical protein SAMD00019534_068130 [Acytostelium subglobosum LB1]GAM23638.1 hypothetical protein SAMD00019534_068130 [Acytostelium subglobosum LB1]|eukprot:XP_012753379.1 hypothetical protein SAMD00019534_068130 [Acytostelium subglobosum LB1]
MISEHVPLSKNQYFYIVACAFLGTLGVMGLVQQVLDIILGVALAVVMLLGIRGVWKRKKNNLFVFMWILIGLAFIQVIGIAVTVILYKTKHRVSHIGFYPGVILDVFRVIYLLALSFFTSYIRNTLGYKRPPTQLNRI